jgi:hypothetical protein
MPIHLCRSGWVSFSSHGGWLATVCGFEIRAFIWFHRALLVKNSYVLCGTVRPKQGFLYKCGLTCSELNFVEFHCEQLIVRFKKVKVSIGFEESI